MRKQPTVAAVVLAIFCGVSPAANAQSKCQIQKYAELRVTMDNFRPLIKAKLNGVELTFIADSGGFHSMITKDTAKLLKLRSKSLPKGMYLQGVDGAFLPTRTTVKSFSLNGLKQEINDIEFAVNDTKLGDGIAGLIGQNILGQSDIEFDLANNVIRLLKSESCSGQSLAYWAPDSFSAVMPLDDRVKSSPHHSSIGQLNGRRIRVLFDSGATRSFVDARTSIRLGIWPGAEGVTAAGTMGGVGGGATATWLARFDSLDLGGELVKNARLRIGRSDIGKITDMLLGTDFFLSHRIYISKQQMKIYFTYNGGPVFDLGALYDADALAKEQETKKNERASAIPKNAADFRRRAQQSMSRFERDPAIADYDEAVKLEPGNAENLHLRAYAKVSAGYRASAQEDFDRAIALDPKNYQFYMGRGDIKLLGKDIQGADSDFEMAISLAPAGGSAEIRVANVYQALELYDQSIKYLDKWLADPKHQNREMVLNQRCWMRAMNRKDLELALEDCNSAINKSWKTPNFYDSRGMVLLQLGRYEEAILDYQRSLRMRNYSSWSHYGLGIAQIRVGQVDAGKQSIERSISLDQSVSEEFARLGIEP